MGPCFRRDDTEFFSAKKRKAPEQTYRSGAAFSSLAQKTYAAL
jgi:hypothetical protein